MPLSRSVLKPSLFIALPQGSGSDSRLVRYAHQPGPSCRPSAPSRTHLRRPPKDTGPTACGTPATQASAAAVPDLPSHLSSLDKPHCTPRGTRCNHYSPERPRNNPGHRAAAHLVQVSLHPPWSDTACRGLQRARRLSDWIDMFGSGRVAMRIAVGGLGSTQKPVLEPPRDRVSPPQADR